jgi:transcriptional regulator with XRE-family HTH domain
MMKRARKREGLRLCRAAWMIGVSVREYRELEADDREPSPGTYERISELYEWPETHVHSSDQRTHEPGKPFNGFSALTFCSSTFKLYRWPQM